MEGINLIIKVLIIVSLSQYLYKGSLDFRASFKNWLYRTTHPTRNTKAEDSLMDYKPYSELAEVYREPTLGSAKELEPFRDFAAYRPDIFNEENLNLPTGIYEHEEDDNETDTLDIYEHEVAL